MKWAIFPFFFPCRIDIRLREEKTKISSHLIGLENLIKRKKEPESDSFIFYS